MYFEFSASKLLFLAAGVFALLVSVGAFLAVNARYSLIARTHSSFSSAIWNSLYDARFRVVSPDTSSTTPPDNRSAQSVPVLLYHGESEAGNMPWSVFVAHMRALHDAGWRTLTLAQLRDFLKEGKAVPDKSFMLTFDDGRVDTYYPADPVLADLGFTAVMFVITGFSLHDGGPAPSFYLDTAELRRMQESGRWELQSHGDQDHRWYAVQSTTDLSQAARTVQGHFMSNKFWSQADGRFETDAEYEARLRNDLETSKRGLEETFGRPVYAYAFPFNDYGQDSENFPGASDSIARVVPAVYEFGFIQVWSSNGDMFNHPGTGSYMVKRIEPKSNWTTEYLLSLLDSGRAKQLPFSDKTFGIDWVPSWGDVRVGSPLSLSGSNETTGASVFLNGSGSWGNYRMDVSAVFNVGDISLVARNSDNHTYVACAFAPNQVDLEEHLHDERRTLARIARPFVGDIKDARLSIEVRGNKVSCLENGTIVASGLILNPLLAKGGVGLVVWNPEVGSAHADIKGVSVVPLP